MPQKEGRRIKPMVLMVALDTERLMLWQWFCYVTAMLHIVLHIPTPLVSHAP